MRRSLSAEPAPEGCRRMLSIPARSRRIGLDDPARVCNSAVMGHTMHPAMLPDSQAPQASGWRAASFAISTPQGRLDVDGIVRSPFGIDQRTIDEAGPRGWSVTHLPCGGPADQGAGGGFGVRRPDRRTDRLDGSGNPRHTGPAGAGSESPGPSL